MMLLLYFPLLSVCMQIYNKKAIQTFLTQLQSKLSIGFDYNLTN